MKFLLYFALAMMLSFFLKSLGFVLIAKVIAFLATLLLAIQFLVLLIIFIFFIVGLIVELLSK